MAVHTTTASELAELLRRRLGGSSRIGVRAWDGTRAGPEHAPVLVVHTPRAVTRMLYRPGQLGLARALVLGEADVEGDLTEFLRRAPRAVLGVAPGPGEVLHALATARRLRVPPLPPRPPRQEVHRRLRPAAAVAHHYDMSDSFYRLVLGPGMVYSCAYWTAPPHGDGPGDGLSEAQRAKLDLVCRKLRLGPGTRLLDAGCGWGALTRHAVRHYGATAVAVTLSPAQARHTRRMLEREGLAGRADVRHGDFRDLTDGPYDAIACLEISHHVPRHRLAGYSAVLHRLLAPGGLLLDQHVSVRHDNQALRRSAFLRSYVFPDLHVAPLHRTLGHYERAGFEIADVENLRDHFALTFRAWSRNLEGNWDRAVQLVGPVRARAWRLYMAALTVAQESGWSGVNHVLAQRPCAAPGIRAVPRRNHPPLRRTHYPAGHDRPN
ncbi:SAM-dependent methyltransferase [Streptomyces caatingaensis]|uniref:Cyclopropane-fatty-acyl-phospholipid synthase n=1 Tax=Streptomyces caatingaensis TaxID=1678637 RepID=A0A0K9XKG4_9ACTN|nr:cyclopropane-fatty-acyl-phospholipid synthase family protein [Streptomyces caatingaensis]KNB53864.1 hypothetical protein AC230_04565 [Streptomyces caatingaensis]